MLKWGVAYRTNEGAWLAKCLEMEEPRESFTWSGRASRISFKAEAPSEASEREANDRTPSDFGDEDRFAEKQVRGGGEVT